MYIYIYIYFFFFFFFLLLSFRCESDTRYQIKLDAFFALPKTESVLKRKRRKEKLTEPLEYT